MMAEAKFYWRLLLRRLPIMLAIVIICSAAGLIQAVRLPATYEAAARLLVESAIVEREIVTTSAAEELPIVRGHSSRGQSSRACPWQATRSRPDHLPALAPSWP